MFDALKYGLLVAVAVAASAVVALVVYNFVANDWRLEGNPLDVLDIFSDEEVVEDEGSAFDDRTRTQAHRFRADSVQPVSIDVDHLHVRVSHADLSRILVQFLLSGDAADTARFAARAWRDSLGVLRITGRATADTGDFRGEVIISLPVQTRLLARAGKGSISMTGIRGHIDAEVRVGNIEADGLTGTVRLFTRRGTIALSGSQVGGELRADTGGVRTSFTDGALVVRASDLLASRHFGSIDARCDRQVAVELVSPDVSATLNSRRGDVALRLLPSGSFLFDLRAPRGMVTVNLALDTMTTPVADRRRLKGELNGGQHRIRVEADSGDVDVSPVHGRES